MLAILLKILSVLGIILLVVLGILLLTLLLVLFMPIVYRIHAEKDAEVFRVNGKVRWLFGLVRVRILYPEPGTVVVKFLWFTLYDSGKTVLRKSKSKKKKPANAKNAEETTTSPEDVSQPENNTKQAKETKHTGKTKRTEEQKNKEAAKATETFDSQTVNEANEEPQSLKEKLFAKYEKIKYTLKKIYDKIKHILENITFYKELLQDAETKGLLSHGWKRLEKIFRSIRPRKLKADVIFGTGSPDTTGYAYGIYGMIMPKLGKQVVVTPDFNEKILEGQVDAAGYIMVFTLLRHVFAVVFDKRLWRLKEKLDIHQKKMKQET